MCGLTEQKSADMIPRLQLDIMPNKNSSDMSRPQFFDFLDTIECENRSQKEMRRAAMFNLPQNGRWKSFSIIILAAILMLMMTSGAIGQGFIGAKPKAKGSATDVISLQIELNQDYYLPKEEISATVILTNFSGQTLELGKTATWMNFEIENSEGRPELQERIIDASGEFELKSALRAKKRLDITKGFDLFEPGVYQLTAFVDIPDWGRVASSPKKFQILSGINYWSRMFGAPSLEGGNKIETRKYSLIQAIYLKESKMYVRVDSVTESKILSVFSIGPMVSLSKPSPQIDRWNNLHVLYQIGLNGYVYNVISPDGEHLRRKYYLKHATNFSYPQMYPDAQGRIFVVGGTLQERWDDVEHKNAPPAYPEPVTDVSQNSAPSDEENE